jgi:adenosylcobinamide hydrolase
MKMRTRFRIAAHTLIIDLGKPQRVLSSAPRGGGFLQSRYILNHQVSANPTSSVPTMAPCRTWENPARYLGRVARDLDVAPRCVGLMTAVPLEHLVLAREERDDLWVEAFVTVGLSNAVRAGEPPTAERGASVRPGTINIVLVTNAGLPPSAMVGALQVAIESKAATVLASHVRSWTGRAGATGTGTDAIVLASGGGPAVAYSGTHTKLGAMLGQAVAHAVQEGITRWKRWKDRASCAVIVP